MVPYGLIWSCMFMVPYGSVWSCMVSYGSVLFRIAPYITSNKFKMYAGFNGEFRRKPVVSIRGVGASKKETKEDLLKWLDLDLSHGGINNNPAAVRLKYQVTVN